MSVNLPWIIGISGASGTLYARRLLKALAENATNQRIDLIISEGAFRVLQEEDHIAFSDRESRVRALIGLDAPQITLHNNRDTGAAVASGSYETAGMVIVPCSMATTAAVATGFADNLLRRTADVQLKERRRLIIVPRETPLSTLHLENLLKLSRLGVTIIPAMPGFYHGPKTIDDLADMLVLRILDHMGIQIDLVRRWKSEITDSASTAPGNSQHSNRSAAAAPDGNSNRGSGSIDD